MATKLYETDYIECYYHDEYAMNEYRWLESTENMSQAEFRQEAERQAQSMFETNPLRVLSDNLNFRFPIGPELQEWILRDINPQWIEAGVKKLATIVPEEIFSHISIQQTVDEVREQGVIDQFEMRYFDNHGDAQEWLEE